jgi:Cu-processing system permease protein
LLIARTEFMAASRLWWIRLFTAAYALLTVAMAHASGAVGDTGAGDTFAHLTVAVLPLALMLVPLASLLVGTSGASEPGETALFITQPVSRREFVLGRWLGQAAAISTALVFGFGAGGALVAAMSGATDAARLVTLVALCVLGGLAFLSIGTLVATAAPGRHAALGAAAFIWFVMVIFYDAAVLGLALLVPGTAGARVLFVSVFGNVLDLVRVVALLAAGTPYVLGAAGESWLRALGGVGAATALSAAALIGWIVLPLAFADRIYASREA